MRISTEHKSEGAGFCSHKCSPELRYTSESSCTQKNLNFDTVEKKSSFTQNMAIQFTARSYSYEPKPENLGDEKLLISNNFLEPRWQFTEEEGSWKQLEMLDRDIHYSEEEETEEEYEEYEEDSQAAMDSQFVRDLFEVVEKENNVDEGKNMDLFNCLWS
jgi:hypothetical protein